MCEAFCECDLAVEMWWPGDVYEKDGDGCDFVCAEDGDGGRWLDLYMMLEVEILRGVILSRFVYPGRALAALEQVDRVEAHIAERRQVRATNAASAAGSTSQAASLCARLVTAQQIDILRWCWEGVGAP